MVFLVGTVVLGVVGASTVGLVGTPGVFTADECHLEERGTTGSKSTSCSGVFVSHDGSLVDREAPLAWPGGRAGEHTQVRTVVFGGYTREHSVDTFYVTVLFAVSGALSVGCAFAGLPPATRDRLAVRLPDRAFAAYVEFKS